MEQDKATVGQLVEKDEATDKQPEEQDKATDRQPVEQDRARQLIEQESHCQVTNEAIQSHSRTTSDAR